MKRTGTYPFDPSSSDVWPALALVIRTLQGAIPTRRTVCPPIKQANLNLLNASSLPLFSSSKHINIIFECVILLNFTKKFNISQQQNISGIVKFYAQTDR